MKMGPSSKLVWTTATCNFCPRTDVRACQIRSETILSKCSTALLVETGVLNNATSICTCCFADLDMILRADAIRGAMLSHYQDHYKWKNSSQSSNSQQHDNMALSVTPNPKPVVIATGSINMSVVSSQSKMSNNMYYKCLLCDKISASKSHCMEHLVRHSDARPFTCLQCEKTYKSRKACREHIMVQHKLSRHQEKEINDNIKVDTVMYQQMKSICNQYEQLYIPEESSTSGRARRSTNHSAADPMSNKLANQAHDMNDASTPVKQEVRTYSPDTIDLTDLAIPPPPAHEQNNVGTAQPPSINTFPAMPILKKRPFTDREARDSLFPYHSPAATPQFNKKSRKGIPHKVEQPEDDDDCIDLILGDSLPAFPEPSMVFSTSPVPHHMTSNMETNDHNSRFPNNNNIKGRPIPSCEICGRQFVTREKRIDHMRSHSQVKQFSCKVCNRYFKYRRGVTNHLKEVHKYTDRNLISTSVICHENGEGVPRCIDPVLNHNLSSYSQDHSDSSSGEVDDDVIAATINHLDEALQVATPDTRGSENEPNDDGDYICMECGEMFETTSELTVHAKTHVSL